MSRKKPQIKRKIGSALFRRLGKIITRFAERTQGYAFNVAPRSASAESSPNASVKGVIGDDALQNKKIDCVHLT